MERAGGQGRRVTETLDGIWAFRHGCGEMREAVVPLPWQAQFGDLKHSSGRALYSRRFRRPDMPRGAQAVLRFGAVSYLAEVVVNGRQVGVHEGGYLPFECVIPPEILEDDNILEVLCSLPDGDPASADAARFGEIPHGKQSWYGPIGGIWQSVVLETRDPCHLQHCAISADLTGRVEVCLTAADGALGADARLTVTDAAGDTVASCATAIGAVETRVSLQVAGPLLWSPEAPNLYELRVELCRSEVLDCTSHSFGFRHFEAREGKFFLNGAPFYMRAALDQDYYPEGICTPPSVEYLEDQMRKARELGLNMLRCHIKVPDPRYYEVADRLGMLVWTEIPNVATFTEASAGRLRETMEGILRRDGNHPCIVIWTLINEDWGTRLCEDASHRRWLAETFDWLKQRDPSRLVVDNSPCHGNFHVKSDIDDFHYYRSVPERRAEWDALTAEFAAGAEWTYSPFGDAQRSGAEPRVVSEFGVWGLPDPARVQIGGAEPWWMGTGGTWGDGAAYPHGVEDRYESLRLNTVFGNFERFIAAAQWYQFANLKYEIEVMRSWPSIQGYVITELTDVHWESNGLLDMNRNDRVFHGKFGSINADVVIVPRVDRYSGWSGDTFRFDVSVATGGRRLAKSEIRWRTGDGTRGSFGVEPIAALEVRDAGEIAFTLPGGGPNRMLAVEMELVADGSVVARNQVEIAVFTRPVTAERPSLGTKDAALAEYLGKLGYWVVEAGMADAIVVHALDPSDIAAMQSGKRYLVLADGTVDLKGKLRTDTPRREQPFIPVVDMVPGIPGHPESQLPNIALHARHGTMWRGDWIAGFSWIRRSGVLDAMPGGPLLGLEYDRVMPHHVMTGFRAWEFGGPVHAGVVVGWVHKPAAFIAERKVGTGHLVATTFRLTTEEAGTDPVAAVLLDALVRLAAGQPAEV